MSMRDLIKLIEDIETDSEDGEGYTFDVRVWYDSFMAQVRLDEFLANSNGDCEVTVYDDGAFMIVGDPYKRYFTEEFVEGLTKNEVVDFYEKHIPYENVDLRDMMNEIDDIDYSDIDELDKYLSNLKDFYNELSDARKMLKELTLDEAVDHFIEQGERREIDYDYTVYGSSQGEQTRVIVSDNVPEYVTKEFIENILYKQPIYAKLTITDPDGEEDEIYLDEYMDNEYEWDKDDVISEFKELYDGELKDKILEFLEEELPNYPD